MARALVREIKDSKKNYIINGAMEVAQRGTSFVSPGHGTYTLDRFIYNKNGAMLHTISQDTDVPTVLQSGYTFKNSLRLNLTTPDTSLATNEFALIDQIVEGYNYSEFAQKSFTLSFWVKATTPGVYGIAFRNLDNTQSLVYDYAINAANTWEKKTISVPAMTTSGNWNYTNGIGLRISFVLAAASNFQTVPGAWQPGTFIGTANQINGVNTGATDFRITGVMLNEGTTAAPFSLHGRSFNGEVLACQRYYEKSYDLTTNPGSSTIIGSYDGMAVRTDFTWTVFYKATKRVPPTLTGYSTTGSINNVTQIDGAGAGNRALLAIYSAQNNSIYGANVFGATGVHFQHHWVADAELA